MFGQKSYKFQFFEDEKKNKKFAWMDFEHFNIYMDEKHILAYNLSFKKCHMGSDSSKLNSRPKYNTFQFYEDEKT